MLDLVLAVSDSGFFSLDGENISEMSEKCLPISIMVETSKSCHPGDSWVTSFCGGGKTLAVSSLEIKLSGL